MTTPRRPPAADPLPHARDQGGAPPDEAPPFGVRWGVLYALVVAELAGMILLCGWLTVSHP